MSAAQWNSTLCWCIPSLVHSAFNYQHSNSHLCELLTQCYNVTFTIGKFCSLVHAQQFPQPPYREDLFLSLMSFFLPFLLVLSFLYSAGVFVKVIMWLNIHHLQCKVRIQMCFKQCFLTCKQFVSRVLFFDYYGNHYCDLPSFQGSPHTQMKNPYCKWWKAGRGLGTRLIVTIFLLSEYTYLECV